MKSLVLLIPFILGGLTVVQSVLNRSVGLKYGWSVAGVMNNAIGILLALVVTGVIFAFFSGRGVNRIDEWHWWYLIPGCIGMLFVMGVPFSIQQIGASKTFVLLVASQILFGLLWDWMSDVTVNGLRLAGVILALAGAVMVSLS